jgi:LysM repeat protein
LLRRLPDFVFSRVDSYSSYEKRDEPMNIKRIFQLIVVIAILVSSFASTGGALAWSNCASYIVVQWGDTLSGLAVLCGTTVNAIRAANPGLGWWVYAGQVLYIPGGNAYDPAVYYPTYGNTYRVQWGDTLGKIAGRLGVGVSDILAINPQIWNPSLIYAEQVINLPGSSGVVTATIVPSIPTPVVVLPDYAHVRMSYKKGLLVRSGPGYQYDTINSALYKTTWQYRTSSVFMDAKGFVWAEVTIYPPENGYASGWILVKDGLGNYFTDPHIDP